MRFALTTRGRLTLAAAGILAVTLAMADIGAYFALSFVQSQEVDHQLRVQSERIGDGLGFVDGRVVYSGDGLPNETPDGVAVDLAVIGDSGVLAATPNQPFATATLEDLSRPALREGHVITLDTRTGGETRRVYVTPLPDRAGQRLVLVASTSMTESQNATTRTMVLLVLGSILVFGAGLALVYSLLGRALRPVRRIARLAQSLSERDLHRRVEVNAPDDELGELVRTFNRMLARLESSFNTLRAFTADASHELRSPLALMQTELEVALGRQLSHAEYQQILRLQLSEVHQMTTLVERLLLLARSDAGELKPRHEPVDVADLLHDAYARWLARASRDGVKLEVSAPDSGTVQADLELTRRILDNLLENAVRHSPLGGVVRLSANDGSGGWCLEVADQGAGVPEAERLRVFERFARGDPARTPDAEAGTGLGLPLSAAFARAQGGEVRLVQKPGWGAVFQLWLPAEAPA